MVGHNHRPWSVACSHRRGAVFWLAFVVLACGEDDPGPEPGAAASMEPTMTGTMQGSATSTEAASAQETMPPGPTMLPTAGMPSDASGTMNPGSMETQPGTMDTQPGTMQPGAMDTQPGAMDAQPGAMDDTQPGAMDPEPPASGGVLPPVESTEMDGPFESEVDTSGPHHVWRPTEMGKDGLKHPVFVWGTGAGATPDRYNGYFGRFATHGIVVVAPTPASLSASNMSSALAWILEQNDTMGSDYYQMIDPDRIGMGGHSQGSVATFNVAGMEDRLKTTIHVAGGSFDGRGSSKVKAPTAYICGETDFALPNCETDFENVEGQPTFFAVLDGVDHVAAARNAMPGMVAWLRWHLGGETERAAQFTGPDGEFHQGIWDSKTKNWNF